MMRVGSSIMKFKNTCISTDSKTFYSHKNAERMQTKWSSSDSDVIHYVITITGLCICYWYQFRSRVPHSPNPKYFSYTFGIHCPLYVVEIFNCIYSRHVLQCFDAVGWAAGKASGLWKLSSGVLEWLSVWCNVTAQLMPLPLIVSCFGKIQIGFTFLIPAHLGSPGQSAVKCVHARAIHVT